MSAVRPFDWPSVKRGEKAELSLSFEAQGHKIKLPVLAARGANDGKTLVVSAGVHGDEYEGVQAIFDVFHALDAAVMRGNMVAVPVANPPAFWNISRTSPLDGGNLARVFPGDCEGTPTQAIAFHLDQRVLALADFYLDLHSAGVKWLMPTLVGYHASQPEARDAAMVFGAPVIWSHPSIAPGRTVSAAAARGIPSLYVEARGSGRIDRADLMVYRRGIRNVLRFLRILNDPLEHGDKPVILSGDGNIDSSVTSTQRGFLTPCVELLHPVETGQPLGTLYDMWGRELEIIRSPREGVVVLIHACPLVQPEEPLFLVTERIG